MRIKKIYDAADGSGTPGAIFTATLNEKIITKEGERLDYLMLGVKGAVATAAVVIEDFADLINPLTLRYGGDNRLVLTLQELIALSVFYYGKRVAIGENTDVTGNDFIGGIKIPVYQTIESGRDLTIQLDRSAVTNITTETVALTGYWDTGETNKKPIHCVRVAHTTSATAGIETYGSRIVPKGKLIGLIIAEPSGFADSNIDTSIQRVKILENGEEVAHLNDLADAVSLADIDYVTPSVFADLLRPYRAFDFRPNGFDPKANEITLQFDVQDVSDAIVILPVIEIE